MVFLSQHCVCLTGWPGMRPVGGFLTLRLLCIQTGRLFVLHPHGLLARSACPTAVLLSGDL